VRRVELHSTGRPRAAVPTAIMAVHPITEPLLDAEARLEGFDNLDAPFQIVFIFMG
jgi:hypothetical protein